MRRWLNLYREGKNSILAKRQRGKNTLREHKSRKAQIAKGNFLGCHCAKNEKRHAKICALNANALYLPNK